MGKFDLYLKACQFVTTKLYTRSGSLQLKMAGASCFFFSSQKPIFNQIFAGIYQIQTFGIGNFSPKIKRNDKILTSATATLTVDGLSAYVTGNGLSHRFASESVILIHVLGLQEKSKENH